jgi:folate-dependent phosphoribosylglycinamide formyltransferase PurN
MNKPKLIIFSSGTSTGGGSGFENLVIASRSRRLNAEIVKVVSSNPNGGVKEKADRLGVDFLHFEAPYTAERYQSIVSNNEWVSLSGWLKLVTGLDPRKTFNIHPGPLPRFGGKGMYGHHVHDAVIEAYRKGEITHSEVTMHFVTEIYDEGPVFMKIEVPIYQSDDAESLGKRVNQVEHAFQPIYTNLVLSRQILWMAKTQSRLRSEDKPKVAAMMPRLSYYFNL